MCLMEKPRVSPDHLLITSELTYDALSTIVNGEKLAVMVPGWYPCSVCDEISTKLGQEPWTAYTDPSAQGINTLGGALFNCVGGSIEDGCEYWDKADAFQTRLERIFFPYQHPMSRLKDLLDRIAPDGCSTLKVDGKTAFFGLLRRFHQGGEALPHTDNSGWDWPRPETTSLKSQLFANVYLSRTEHGGDLQIWGRQIATTAEYNAIRDGKTYGLRRDVIGAPKLILTPPVGALVIGNARCIHAVTPATGAGMRLSSSAFIGVGRRLFIYS
jgi:hypothetical protein